MAFNKNKVMDAARKYVEKGQTDRAIKEYLKVVDHDPKDVRVWLKIGDLYAKKGAKAEATETYLKVAKFYSEQGFYLKAVAVYKQILKLDPRMVEVNLKLAELYRQLGLLSDAMQHFERVAAHFHREGKTQEALATIRQLVDLDPDNVATRIKLAELYSKEELNEEAIQEFRHACDYLRSHSRQDDFLKVAERLLWHDASDIPLNRELATLYLRRNDARRALQKLQVCFKADSRDVETLALLAQAFQALDQKSKTVSVLKELARVFTETGQTQQAEDVHRKILMFAPDDPDSREALGEPPSIRQSAGIPEPSLAVAEAAATPRPGMGNPTGSMPIVHDPDDLEMEVDGYTEDESDSFVADIAVEEESYQVSNDQVEANADEIVKILTETDVYVKYGLQQKAIDHLQRVFELDPNNVEARERLKDIYVADGGKENAIAELITLAKLVAAQDPNRADMYLNEASELDPGNVDVRRCAEELQIDIGSGPEVEIVDDLSAPIELIADDSGTGNVAPVEGEMEFDEIEFGDAGGDLDMSYESNSEPAVKEAPEYLTDSEDVGELELGSYDGARAAAPRAMEADPDRPITQEVQLDQLEEELSIDDSNVEELSFDDVVEGTNELAVEDLEFDSSVVEEAPGQELAATFDDPQSLDAAPMDVQDMELPSEVPQRPGIATPLAAASEHLGPNEVLGRGAGASEPTHTQQTSGEDSGGTSLEDDLDEADFFVSQSLFEEARDILNGLLEKYPSHPLIVAKLQDIDAMQSGDADDAAALAPDEFDSAPMPDERIEQQLESEPKSRVRLEHDVADEDADTHFDLGLAYKEMGLFDEAIKSFKKVVNSANRGVESNLMIGLCQREQGALAEAVQQFKNGLYVDGITDTEKVGLYYEIGITYEAMEDPGEALYFYEMVYKKEASHRDIGERIHSVRAAAAKNGNGAQEKRKAPVGGDDIDAAFDRVIGGKTDDISQH